MPANLTPEYRKAEELYRQAQSTEEKITALELMLQTIPKHKGTDHMQADLKRRLSKLREAPTTKAGARHADVFHVPKGAAAGQAALLGTPNSGKSALVANTTNAHVQVADFPFSTHAPVPGIFHYGDIQIQLVDMPPITREHVEPGQTNTYRHCDLILVVVDLSAADVTDELEICLDYLNERKLILPPDVDPDDEIYKRMSKPCLGVATKSDLVSAGDFGVFKEMYGAKLDLISTSINEPASLDALGRRIFEILKIIRVYTKQPGKEAEIKDPFTLPIGATVYDLAVKVHRELADKLRYARAWGEDKYPGQQIPRDYPLHDKDLIELHFA
jgi:ribosome-interacting GTPase 1